MKKRKENEKKLDNLCNDVIIESFLFLYYEDVKSMRLINKYFNRVISTKLFWTRFIDWVIQESEKHEIRVLQKFAYNLSMNKEIPNKKTIRQKQSFVIENSDWYNVIKEELLTLINLVKNESISRGFNFKYNTKTKEFENDIEVKGYYSQFLKNNTIFNNVITKKEVKYELSRLINHLLLVENTLIWNRIKKKFSKFNIKLNYTNYYLSLSLNWF